MKIFFNLNNQIQNIVMSNTTNNSTHKSEHQEQYIKELKAKLHSSFLQISELQELNEEEIKQLKKNYEAKIYKLEQQKQQVLNEFKKTKGFCQIDDKAQQYFCNVDYSIICPKFHKAISSFLQEEQNQLILGNNLQNCNNLDDNSISARLKTKENSIKNAYKNLPKQFQEYIALVQDLSKQNIQLKLKTKQMLLNRQNYQQKVHQLQKQLNLMSKSESKLKQENLQLTNMYKSQLILNGELESKLHNLDRKGLKICQQNNQKRGIQNINNIHYMKM